MALGGQIILALAMTAVLTCGAYLLAWLVDEAVDGDRAWRERDHG